MRAWGGLLGLEVVVGLAIAAIIIWGGAYNVAASAGHWGITRWVLHTTMKHSVARHAPHLAAPDLDDGTLVRLGAAYFRKGCAPCHGAPGVLASPIARGMTPVPPPLYDAARNFNADQLHWIIKHGIKMTAMPAWSAAQRDDEEWALVAFLRRLPGLTAQQFAVLTAGPDGAPAAALVQTAPASARACVACHGAAGQGMGAMVPVLAGLGAPYVEAALHDFANGARPSGFMRTMAGGLTDADIRALGAYYSGLAAPARRPPSASPALLARGRALAGFSNGGAPPCLSCHAENGAKHNAAIPPLRQQSADYLARQLRLYRAGIRGGTQAARAMQQAAQGLGDEEIAAVSAYFASLSATSSTAD